MTRAMVAHAFAIGIVVAATMTSAYAQGRPSAAPPARSFVAMAMADGPTPEDRLSLTFRGTNSTEVVSNAVRACYEQAAPGYMHTCQIWYGTGWVVGTLCPQAGSNVRFAIGDDRESPEAAAAKAIAHLRDVEHADVSECRIVAETNADEMQVARSAAKDRQR